MGDMNVKQGIKRLVSVRCVVDVSACTVAFSEDSVVIDLMSVCSLVCNESITY